MPDSETPFDRAIIQTLRERADAHSHDPYGKVPMNINWAWFSRMVATMEETLK